MIQLLRNALYELVNSGVLRSRGTWAAVVGFLSMGILSVFGVEISEVTQVATAAAFTLVVIGIGFEDFIIGRIPYAELEKRLIDLLGRREFVTAIVGTVALWIQDIYGYTWDDATTAAVIVLWLALVGKQTAFTVGNQIGKARAIGVGNG